MPDGAHDHDLSAYATTAEVEALRTDLGLLKVRVTSLAARVTALEAEPPTEPPSEPPIDPPTAGLPTTVGFGANALSNLGTAEYEVNRLSGTGAGSFPAAVAWLNAGNSGRLWFSVNGTIALGNGGASIRGAHDFLVDGRGSDITFTGGSIEVSNGAHHFAFVNLRHRGGGTSGDNFNAFEGCHDYAWINISASGAYDEGISNTSDCSNYSMLHCVLTGDFGTHDYGSLNYGWKADRNGQGTFYGNVWVNKTNRCPTLRYRGDPEDGSPNSSAPDPRAITYDAINNVAVRNTWPLTAYLGAKVNSVNSFNSGNGHTETAGSGAVIRTDFPVPPWAREGIVIRSPADARTYALANAGCRPLDSRDQTKLALVAAAT